MDTKTKAQDAIMSVVSNFTRHELEKFAKHRGIPLDELEQMIARWKAERLQ